MSDEQMSSAPVPVMKERILALSLMFRQFSMLIEAGTTLVGSLGILSREARRPYNTAADTLCQRVMQGATLTAAMGEQEALFPAVIRGFVRSGEVGGMLDETLRYTADILEEGWKFANLTGRFSPLLSIFANTDDRAPQNLKHMRHDHRAFTLMVFCRMFGLLLSSGVPILQSMELTAEILPPVQREAWLEVREKIRVGARVSVAEFFPEFVLMLIKIGEETGSLDQTMLKAADYYHHVLEAEYWGRLQTTSAGHP